MKELKAELQRLYADSSKHSVYQNVPDFVSAELGYTESIDESWRGDRPRLAFLATYRTPANGEVWLDFGANTGFFVLSLAHNFPQTSFFAVEANPNHARFIERVARYFGMHNIEVIQQVVGLRELLTLPRSDFMLHLNVLHHAGHDFDAELVPERKVFSEYARRYLSALSYVAGAMLFQMGSNWGGDRNRPLVDARADGVKLATFRAWLGNSGWNPHTVAYAHRDDGGRVEYEKLEDRSAEQHNSWSYLDRFSGEFYRRPLFACDSTRDTVT